MENFIKEMLKIFLLDVVIYTLVWSLIDYCLNNPFNFTEYIIAYVLLLMFNIYRAMKKKRKTNGLANEK